MGALSGLSGASGLSSVAGRRAMIPWLPTMEPSLVLWIDPSDTTGWTVDGSGKPTAIRSKTSTQDVLSLTTGTAPTISNGAIVVTDALTRFSADTRLGLPADPALLICGVATPVNANTIFDLGGSGVGKPQLNIGQSEYAWRYGNGASVFPSANGANQVLFSATREPGIDRSTARMRADGNELATTATIDGTTTVTAEFVSIFFGAWSGTLDEILAFSSTEQALIERTEGYLAHKRGRTAQLPATHPYKFIPPMVPAPVAGALDPDAAAYIAAVEAADGEPLEPALVTAYTDFIVGCKADPSPFAGVSNYDAIKGSCVMAGARTLSGALVPLVGPAPTNFNFVAGDYNRVGGLKGNGFNKHLGSNRLNSADPQDNNHKVLYTTFVDKQGYGLATVGAGTGRTLLGVGPNVAQANNHSGAFSQSVNAGFVGQSRVSASEWQFSRNGTQASASQVSENPIQETLLIFARGNPGSPLSLTDARLSFYSIGEAVDLAALDARLTTLMAAIAAALA